MAKRIKIGDVFEIRTAKGLAYGQYTHKHHVFPSLVRILPGLFPSRPEDLAEIVGRKELFVVFFPLQSAINQSIFQIVGNFQVPESAQRFPVFRAGAPDPTGKVQVWWLWDGQKEWKVGQLTEEQRGLPIRNIWNDTLLVERIEEGWSALGNDL